MIHRLLPKHHWARHLADWWSASQRAAEVLLNDATTPDSWHRTFVEEIVPRLPCFGLDYWPKFLYGDIGHHVAPTKVDLQRYTIVGVGCRKLLQVWGLTLPKDGRAAQGPGLDVVRELHTPGHERRRRPRRPKK